jgi:hypothetical protein
MIHPNVQMLQEVAAGLGSLKDEVVFVGGSVTSLYVDDPAAPSVTASTDVDFVIEVAGLTEYERLETELGRRGFGRPVDEEDQRIICRKSYRGILVDVMPTNGKILGFTNRWYQEAVREKVSCTLPNGASIFIFAAPYFVATKLEALSERGMSDIRLSHDLEDIVSVFDGCLTIEAQLDAAPDRLKEYFRAEFSGLIKDRAYFREAVQGFLRASRDYAFRSDRVMTLVDKLVR